MTNSDYRIGQDALGKNGAAFTSHFLDIAYNQAFLPDLMQAEPYLGLTIDGEPVPMGELANAKMPAVAQWLWDSRHPLYMLGVIAPRLHVTRDERPFWTLSLTALLLTSAAAKKRLKTLRRELSNVPRAATFKILDGVAPFAPMGSACIDLEKPEGATLSEPLSGDHAAEALDWVHSRSTVDRVVCHGLTVTYQIGLTIADLQNGWTHVPSIHVSKTL